MPIPANRCLSTAAAVRAASIVSPIRSSPLSVPAAALVLRRSRPSPRRSPSYTWASIFVPPKSNPTQLSLSMLSLMVTPSANRIAELLRDDSDGRAGP
jgi:hypothetical protein